MSLIPSRLRQWFARRGKPADTPRSSGFRNVIENVGWLLAGKGVGALLSLVYLGLATRTLGPEHFGQFVLVLGTGQAIGAFVGFQTWQMVVRYGMPHLHAGRADALDRLTRFSLLLDMASGLTGCVLATIGVLLLGPRMGWSRDLSIEALGFCFVTLLAIRSTPVGLLRLHDRFALSAAADAITPITRFVGALLAIVFLPTVLGFLLAWALAEVASTIAWWTAAIRTTGFRPAWPFRRDVLRVPRDHDGLWHFVWITNIGSTLGSAGKQFTVIIVGLFVGPVAAGSYRLAYQLGQALAKGAEMVSRALFSELARTHVSQGREQLITLFRATSKLTFSAALIILVFLFSIGKTALGLVAGPEYVAAYPLLLLLGTAAAMDISGIGFEPALLTTGRAAIAFRLRIVTTLVLLTLLAVLLPVYGATGAGIATLAASALGMVLFGIAAWRAIHRVA